MSNQFKVSKKFEEPVSSYGYFLDKKAIKTATDSSQAATLHATAGAVTSSTTNLGGSTAQTLTITNNYVTEDSIVLVEYSGGGAGTLLKGAVTASNGSFTATVYNVGSACDEAYVMTFVVISVI